MLINATTDQIIEALDNLAMPNDVTDLAARELERLQNEVRRLEREVVTWRASAYDF